MKKTLRDLDPTARRVRALVLRDQGSSLTQEFEEYLAHEQERFKAVAGDLWISPEEQANRREYHASEQLPVQPLSSTAIRRNALASEASQYHR